MLSRLVLAVVVGVVVTLLSIFIGELLITFEIGWVYKTGQFLTVYGGLLGLLAALWYAFSGYYRWPRP